jgi:hypothetical protein
MGGLKTFTMRFGDELIGPVNMNFGGDVELAKHRAQKLFAMAQESIAKATGKPRKSLEIVGFKVDGAHAELNCVSHA